jgi:hypothetical protein
MNFKRRALYFFRELGLDPIRLWNSPRNLARFLYSLASFLFSRKRDSIKLRLSPALNDRFSTASSADGHYFWQDLIVAKWVYLRNPKQHFDVGSRVDGFIAHLLVFRKVIQLDIRPATSQISGLEILIGNAQEPLLDIEGKFDSVSSLHSIEHFGLGRYGDPLDVNGHEKGLRNISKTVVIGGELYVSFPIGMPSIEFNSQRVISPEWPVAVLQDFELVEFVLIPWRGAPIKGKSPADVDLSLTGQAGVYKLKRIR